MILGSSSTPFTNLIMSAPNNSHSFELGNVSVTIKGRAAEVLSVSPNNVTFKVPNDLTGGPADIMVTSRGGFISFSTANVSWVESDHLYELGKLGRRSLAERA